MNFDFLLLILLHRENDDIKNIINFSDVDILIWFIEGFNVIYKKTLKTQLKSI